MAHKLAAIKYMGNQIAEDLRSSIIRGTMPKGTRIIETELADHYDVSRGPIRDALQLLLSEGLLLRQRQGCIVSGLSENDVRDMYEVRVCFVKLAVDHVAAHPQSISWVGMDDAIGRMKQALEKNDAHAYAQADLNFHEELLLAANNSRVTAFWSVIKPLFSVMLDLTNAQDADLTPSFNDHIVILNLLKNGQPGEASRLISRHLNGSLHRMMTTFSNALPPQ